MIFDRKRSIQDLRLNNTGQLDCACTAHGVKIVSVVNNIMI